MKNPKDKVITYWSGAKVRYRKDGKPDMRYTLGKKIAGLDNLPSKKTHKKTAPKHIPTSHEISLWGVFRAGLIFGAIIAMLIVLQAILSPPRKEKFISPLSQVVIAKETKPDLKDFCNMDKVSEQICMYDWDARKALAIAMAENGYLERKNWWVDGLNINADKTFDAGIMQINSIHGYPLAKLVTIEGNIMYAHRVYASREQWDTDGFNAWVVYKTDRYYRALELIEEYEK